MSYIHPFSDEATTSQLELFKIPKTVTAIESERYFHHKPVSALTSSNWIEFRIPGTEEFVDLSSMLLEIELKVTKADGSQLPEAAAAGANAANLFDAILPANNLLSSLFQQADLFLNNQLVTASTNLYGYRSFFDALFYQSGDAKKTYMHSVFWEEDETKRKERFKRVFAGKTIKLIGPLHLDLCQQERLLLNMVDINLRLCLSDPSFVYKITNNTGDRPKHTLINATLHVMKKKLFSDCEAGILNALGRETAKYFYTHTQLRHRLIDVGSSTFYHDNLFPSILPRRFMVAIVPAAAFNGDFTLDPFTFTSNGVVEVKAFVDSIQIPVPSLELDTDDDDFSRAYISLFESLYSLHPQTKLSITPEQFKERYCVYGWNLSVENDMEDSDTIGLIRRGHVRLDFRFKTPPTKQLACVYYAHFPQVLQIDANREVMLESI